MPRLSNSSTNTAAGSVTNRTGQPQFNWVTSCEFDWRNGSQDMLTRSNTSRGRVYVDDLSAAIDKVLAYAG